MGDGDAGALRLLSCSGVEAGAGGDGDTKISPADTQGPLTSLEQEPASAFPAAAPEETQRTTSPRETPRGFLLEGWQWVPI